LKIAERSIKTGNFICSERLRTKQTQMQKTFEVCSSWPFNITKKI